MPISNGILLDKEQQELLKILIEAENRTSSQKRQEFRVVQDQSWNETISHPGLKGNKVKSKKQDILMLEQEKLILVRHGNGIYHFSVTPKGRDFLDFN